MILFRLTLRSPCPLTADLPCASDVRLETHVSRGCALFAQAAALTSPLFRSLRPFASACRSDDGRRKQLLPVLCVRLGLQPAGKTLATLHEGIIVLSCALCLIPVCPVSLVVFFHLLVVVLGHRHVLQPFLVVTAGVPTH